jgi:glycerol-3-phosphate O-acyltransferase / dihydroxyacetone phosphate acyltransferase
MLYALMKRLARIALRWYYRDVEIVGAHRVPAETPLLIVANHPNAMVDPMLVATAVSRRVTFTGKATLFDNPFLRVFLGALGMVPLRRASDERVRRQAGGAPDPRRNEDAFRAVISALANKQAVLIFPEGKSHDEPSIAPLKTGTARMALQARAAGVGALAILPIGFVFENKSQPRTRILVEVGEPIAVDDWPTTAADAVDRLTDEIDRRLRAVTMNFETAAAAAETGRVSALLAPEGAGALGSGVSWAEVVAVTRRVDSARRVLERAAAAGGELARRADRLRTEVSAAEQLAAREGLDLRDAAIDTSVGSGAVFVAREGAITALAAPFALIGRVVHWPAVTIARAVASRWSESGADPAMQTLLVGAPLVLATWAAITAIVWHFAGGAIALVALVALPFLAECDFTLRDRAARATARLRAYLRFRREPALQQTLTTAIAAARNEAAELERQLLTGNAA